MGKAIHHRILRSRRALAGLCTRCGTPVPCSRCAERAARLKEARRISSYIRVYLPRFWRLVFRVAEANAIAADPVGYGLHRAFAEMADGIWQWHWMAHRPQMKALVRQHFKDVDAARREAQARQENDDSSLS